MKLRIEKAIYGGASLARLPQENSEGQAAAGKAVFVPYSLPGELVEAHLTADRGGFSLAAVDTIVEPSPHRVLPGCEYFPACGGCQYQHADAGLQQQMKLDVLADTLRRAHVELPSELSIGSLSGPPWGYRNRIRLQVLARPQGPGPQAGGIALCYQERGTHRSVPIAHCPIAAPLIERALAAVLRMGRESGIARLGDEIEFFCNGDESELLVSLWTVNSGRAGARSAPRKDRALDHFAEALRALIPELAGVGVFSAPGRFPRLAATWGRGSLSYSVGSRRYEVGIGSFFQVNRFLLPELQSLVTGGRSGRLAWDLYAGAGLFTLGLAFERVISVEASPSSSADLTRNLAGTGHRAVRSDAADFLRAQAAKSRPQAPELIVLDPPRAGLGQAVCAHLVQFSAPVIVYVSCDPATMARDLQALLQSRYRLQSLHMVDLFPQTFHLETVAVLTRK